MTLSMTPEELDKYTLHKGINELYLEISRMKNRISRGQWSEASVRAGEAIKLLQGTRRVINRLEKKKY